MSKLTYLTLSDFHIGHPKVSSEFLLDNFEKYLVKHYKHIKNVDVIFIAGDVTDKPLMSGGADYTMLTVWFIKLASFCKKHDIMLVVMRGTISHDGKTLESFSKMITDMTDVKYEYVDTIKVLTINDTNVLLVPDNTHDDGIEVEGYIEKHILSKGIKLHVAIVHRAFHFQLPIETDESLNMDFWLKHIKYYTHVAHIHTPMTYKRIIGQGSFDRLTHGQEEIKGGIITYLGGTNNRWVFLENENAKVFKRLTFNTIDVPKMIKMIKGYKLGSFIEIVLPKEELRNFNRRTLLNFVKGYGVTFASKKGVEDNGKVLVRKKIEEFDLSPSSIKKLLLKRLPKDMLEDGKLELDTLYTDMRI